MMTKPKKEVMTAFEKDLARVINAHSQENNSNTPDFILARYIDGCLAAFNAAVKHRDKWYGLNCYGTGAEFVAGKALVFCEGCNKKLTEETVKHDDEGVPLCEKCMGELKANIQNYNDGIAKTMRLGGQAKKRQYVKCPQCKRPHRDTGNIGVCDSCGYALIPTFGNEYIGTKYDARKGE